MIHRKEFQIAILLCEVLIERCLTIRTPHIFSPEFDHPRNINREHFPVEPMITALFDFSIKFGKEQLKVRALRFDQCDLFCYLQSDPGSL